MIADEKQEKKPIAPTKKRAIVRITVGSIFLLVLGVILILLPFECPSRFTRISRCVPADQCIHLVGAFTVNVVLTNAVIFGIMYWRARPFGRSVP